MSRNRTRDSVRVKLRVRLGLRFGLGLGLEFGAEYDNVFELEVVNGVLVLFSAMWSRALLLRKELAVGHLHRT